MATGIIKRHTKRCGSRTGGRCRCNGRYEAWVYSRREGQKIWKGFATEAEAKGWRADALKAAKDGRLRTPTRQTIREAGEAWLAAARSGMVRERAGGRYKPSTLRGYGQTFEQRVFPEFGGARLSELRRADLQGYVDRLLGTGLSAGTVRNALNPIQAIFRWALERDLVALNPTVGLRLPAARGRRDRIATPAEAERLLAVLLAEDRAIWAAAFYAGLRRGELRGLRWLDVDLGGSKIRVERSWDQYEGPVDPKSETSVRTIPLLGVLRDHLDAHLLATESGSDDLVFGRTPTEAFVASTVRSRAIRAWEAANKKEAAKAEREGREPDLLSPITLHECRHTFASLLIDAGVNAKAIQTYLGHATIEMTFGRYGHLMPGSRDEARERVDAYLEAAVAGASRPSRAPARSGF